MHPHVSSADGRASLWLDWNSIEEKTNEKNRQMLEAESCMGVVLPNWYAEHTLPTSTLEWASERDDEYEDDYECRASVSVAWNELSARMRQRDYPWLRRREIDGRPMVTVGASGVSLQNVFNNLIAAIRDTRAVMQIQYFDPENPRHMKRAKESMQRRDRNDEHFVIFDRENPGDIYRHEWYMPHDHSNMDINIEKIEVVQEEAVSSRLSVQ